MKMSIKLIYQYMAMFLNFSHTSNHSHPLQVENCDSNSRLVVDEITMTNPGLKGLKLPVNEVNRLSFFNPLCSLSTVGSYACSTVHSHVELCCPSVLSCSYTCSTVQCQVELCRLSVLSCSYTWITVQCQVELCCLSVFSCSYTCSTVQCQVELCRLSVLSCSYTWITVQCQVELCCLSVLSCS